jgi:hypothetical protein
MIMSEWVIVFNYIMARTRYIRWDDNKWVSDCFQLYHGENKVHCSWFSPWYSWKQSLIIISSNVPCSHHDIAENNHSLTHYHLIECTLFLIVFSYIMARTRYIRWDDNEWVSDCFQLYHGENKVHSMNYHLIECTLFSPWYSWKQSLIIISSNVPCSRHDIAENNHSLTHYHLIEKVHSMRW